MLQWGMDLQALVETYQVPVHARTTVEHAKIVLLVGISGAGKDTIKKSLLNRPEFGDIVSHTTRAPRQNSGVMEQDGIDYHFIDSTEAARMLEAGEFVEAKFVHGTVYGTSVREVLNASQAGVAITDIDVQGVSEYKAVSDEVVAIFVVPPNYNTWLERLKKRYTTEEEFQHEWPKRRESAIRELRQALNVPYYHFVINDELARATKAAAEIAQRPDIFTRKDDEARLEARDLLDEILAQEQP